MAFWWSGGGGGQDGEMFVFQGSTAGECIAAMLNPNALDGNSDDATDLSDLQLSAAPSDNALLLHVVVPPGAFGCMS